MQENDFETNLRLKMGELKLVPGEEVWKNVALRIRKEKRRKRFFLFLLVITLLAGSGALYLFTQDYRRSPAITGAAFTQRSSFPGERSSTRALIPGSPASAPSETPATKQSNTITKKSGRAVGKISSPLIQRSFSLAVERPSTNINSITDAGKKGEKRLGSKASAVRTTRAELKGAVRDGFGDSELFKDSPKGAGKEAVMLPERGNEGAKLANKNNYSPTAITPKPEILNAPKTTHQPLPTTLQTPPVKQAETNNQNYNQAGSPDSTFAPPAVNKAEQKPTVPVKNRWKFGVTVFAGVSNNLSGLHLLSTPRANNQYNSPVPGTAASGNAPISKLQYTGGFSYGFGFYTRKQVGKRTWFSAGANYRYASAVSVAGEPVNTTQTFFDANLQYSATVPAYYVAGKSARYTNRYYLLEAPFQLLWQVNRRQDKPVLVTAGVVPSYLFASHALYANLNQNVYYTDNAQFKKWQVAAQAGIEFPLMIQKHLQVYGGPQVQYGLNNMGKTASGTSQHLITAGLKVNITLY